MTNVKFVREMVRSVDSDVFRTPKSNDIPIDSLMEWLEACRGNGAKYVDVSSDTLEAYYNRWETEKEYRERVNKK